MTQKMEGVEINFGHFFGGGVLLCIPKSNRTREMGGRTPPKYHEKRKYPAFHDILGECRHIGSDMGGCKHRTPIFCLEGWFF